MQNASAPAGKRRTTRLHSVAPAAWPLPRHGKYFPCPAAAARPLGHVLTVPRWPVYREFVLMRETSLAIDRVRVGGAGPTLSYEVVKKADTAACSLLTLLCLHGNSSHRGMWRLVARELREYRSVLSTTAVTATATMYRRRPTTLSTMRPMSPRSWRRSSTSLTRSWPTPLARSRLRSS
jgi:hypothetical protein